MEETIKEQQPAEHTPSGFISPLSIQEQGSSLFSEQDLSDAKATALDIASKIEMLQKQKSENEERIRKISDYLQSEKQEEPFYVPGNILGEPTVTIDSSKEAKVNFYMDLFHGRRDLYAHRYYSKNKGSYQYSPVCSNFGTKNCFRTNKTVNTPCMECPFRLYPPLTEKVLEHDQFGNKDPNGVGAIGIYALLPDSTCWFLAIDFDEKDWKESVFAMAKVARENGFEAAIERSRSGNGAHLWLFFDSPVKAEKARNLGFSLLTLAGRESKASQFVSYDRMFPNQSTMPKGGFGNLIQLPLLRPASKNGNTLFIGNDFHAFPDQYGYLSALRRIKEDDIDRFLSTHGPSIGTFSLTEETSLPLSVPRNLLLLAKDVKGSVVLYRSTGISLVKSVFSSHALDVFRRLSSFPNPNYYQMQNMKHYISEETTPRIICGYEENDTVLWLPRGCQDDMEKLFCDAGIPFTIEDHTVTGKRLSASFKGTLREEQEPAYKELLSHEMGILSAATSFGKTIVAAKCIATRKVSTLVIVPTIPIGEQWKEKLDQFLHVDVKKEPKGKKKGRKPKIDCSNGIGLFGQRTGLVDIVTMQSIVGKKKKDGTAWSPPAYLSDYGQVIVDECHHAASDTMVTVMRSSWARYIMGLSATVNRSDKLDRLVTLYVGPVVAKATADKLARERGILQSVITRFLPTRLPLGEWSNPEMLTLLSKDEERNKALVDDILHAIERKRTPLVLTHRIEHAERLKTLLEERGQSVYLLYGKMAKEEQKEVKEKIESMRPANAVIISTGSYFGEGIDQPVLDTLFMATPCAWEGVVTQYAGRIARSYEGKQETWIFDYVDSNIPQLRRMYAKRLSAYRKLGYAFKAVKSDLTVRSQGLAYTAENFKEPLLEDINQAKHSIELFSPDKKDTAFTKRIENAFAIARLGGASVTIHTNTAKQALVIDGTLSWFGNVSLLSISNTPDDSCMLRLVDPAVARATLSEENGLFGV